jgi:3-hydroxy acid dehydrogenase/malonic semialdehyde reductase
LNRIEGKTALITGASSGIGQACARAFASRGAHLVLLARRAERLQELADELTEQFGVSVRTGTVDVRERESLVALRDELEGEGIELDILVNNAGLAAGADKLQTGDFEDWDRMIDTNVKGLLSVIRLFVPGLIERNRGHVVNIGSIAGHQTYSGGGVYNATKYGVRAINEALALDLVGTKVRVSSVDPGLVETEFSEVRFGGDAERAKGVYLGYTPLAPEDVADAVCYVTNVPAHVNVLDLIILPTDQRSAHTVHKDTA